MQPDFPVTQETRQELTEQVRNLITGHTQGRAKLRKTAETIVQCCLNGLTEDWQKQQGNGTDDGHSISSRVARTHADRVQIAAVAQGAQHDLPNMADDLKPSIDRAVADFKSKE